MKIMKRMSVTALSVLVALGVYADYTAQKAEALKRKRDTMYLACGFDACLWPKALKFSVENYPSIRLDALTRCPTQIDALIYQAGGPFGVVMAKIPSGELPLNQPTQGTSTWMANVRNGLPDLIKAGTDPVKEVVKWGAKNKKEIIISLPVNSDEHASGDVLAKPPPPYIWYNYFFPQYKIKNQRLLVGGPQSTPPGETKTKDGKPPFGRWSMVDYGQAEIRTKFITMAREIAENYAIDGLMIDFMKNPTLFIDVAWGGVASAKQCQQLTDMMLAIKKAVDAAGQKRGKAILLSVRVPDSIAYCKDIGIDLQAWLDQKIPDYLLVGGNFELNETSYTGDLAVKSGIPWYFTTTQTGIWVGNDSGYNNDDEILPRHSKESFRARVMAAAQGKASGCVWENPYDWIRFKIDDIPGNLKSVLMENKRYYVSYRNSYGAGSYLKDGMKHCVRANLVSSSPIELKKGPAKVFVNVWDDFDALKKQNVKPRCVLTTESIIPGGMDILVTLNGKPVEIMKKRAGHQMFEVPYGLVKKGANEVIVKQSGRNKRGQNAKLCNVAIDVIIKETPETLMLKPDGSVKKRGKKSSKKGSRK